MKALFIVCFSWPLFLFAQVKKAPAKSGVTTAGSVQASVLRGKTVYGMYCLSCHQADGSGVPNLNPPLIQNSWVLGPKKIFIEQILNGSQGKVEIDGETYHNSMPAMAHLTDQQVADVITYVRNSFGNKASSVLPAEVKPLRPKK